MTPPGPDLASPPMVPPANTGLTMSNNMFVVVCPWGIAWEGWCVRPQWFLKSGSGYISAY